MISKIDDGLRRSKNREDKQQECTDKQNEGEARCRGQADELYEAGKGAFEQALGGDEEHSGGDQGNESAHVWARGACDNQKLRFGCVGGGDVGYWHDLRHRDLHDYYLNSSCCRDCCDLAVRSCW